MLTEEGRVRTDAAVRAQPLSPLPLHRRVPLRSSPPSPSPPPHPQERKWRVKYAFDRYMYWNLETPPTKNDNMLSWRDAVSLAEKVCWRKPFNLPALLLPLRPHRSLFRCTRR